MFYIFIIFLEFIYTNTWCNYLPQHYSFFLHPISIISYILSIYSTCLLSVLCKNLPVVRHSYRIEASIGVDVIVVVIVVPTVWHERCHVKMFRKCHKCLYFLMEVIGMFKSLDTKRKTFASLTWHQFNCHFKKMKSYINSTRL
jgi:hypothetical protein